MNKDASILQLRALLERVQQLGSMPTLTNGTIVHVKGVVMTGDDEEALSSLLNENADLVRPSVSSPDQMLKQLAVLNDKLWHSKTVDDAGQHAKEVLMTLEDVQAFLWAFKWINDHLLIADEDVVSEMISDAVHGSKAVELMHGAQKRSDHMSVEEFRLHPDRAMQLALSGPVIVTDADGPRFVIERSLPPLDDDSAE